jgi:glutamate 5-kinase
METKLLAAKNAMTSGVAAVIARGTEERVIERLFDGEEIGSWFSPAARRLAGRKRWIAFGKSGEGAHLRVDAGAMRALAEGGRSLLPIGVVEVCGRFERGDVVEIQGPEGEVIGRGLVNYAGDQIDKIRGARSDEIAARLGDAPDAEVIHRDNLIIYH